MAGAGWRQFTVGQLLTSAQVQTFLQDQAVQVFASAAARTSALGTAVSAGMVSYRADDRALELYAGSAWQPVMAGKNAIINGGFDIWQRGTTFNNLSASYVADRWQIGFKDGTHTLNITQQTFTPGTAPVSGYEGQFYIRLNTSAYTSGTHYFGQKVEDVRSFAGQTVTLSYWARTSSGTVTPIRVFCAQTFGSGGSSEVDNIGAQAPTYTTTWTRFTQTINIPSISGKTIGSSSFLNVLWQFTPAGVQTVDIWGVQLEAGSVATPFVRAATTLQGELAACQRYYTRFTADNGVNFGGHGGCVTATIGQSNFPLPVTMRVNPTSIDFANVSWYNYGNGVLYNSGSFVLQAGQTNYPLIRYTHGSSIFTAGQSGVFVSNATGGFIGFNAEL